MRAISIGEILWDVKPSGEFLGGAPFNFAYHLSRLGHDVSFISAVGDDERGRRALEHLAHCGMDRSFISAVASHPTGWVDVEFDPNGQPDYVIHRPVAYDFPALDEDRMQKVVARGVDSIYFGTLQQMSDDARALTERLIEAAPHAHRFYDPNLRKNSFTPDLVRKLLQRATIVKVSEEEAVRITRMFGDEFVNNESFCRAFSERFGWEAVAVTRGAEGCALLVRKDYAEGKPHTVKAVDAVGAGDAFSAALLHGVVTGWPAAQIAGFANRVAALIVSLPGAVPDWQLADLPA